MPSEGKLMGSRVPEGQHAANTAPFSLLLAHFITPVLRQGSRNLVPGKNAETVATSPPRLRNPISHAFQVVAVQCSGLDFSHEAGAGSIVEGRLLG